MIDYNYPTAFLGEAVQKNLLITDGTVTVSGNTYTVTGDTVTITNSELETEAFELHQSLCSDMQLRFGSCESAYISFVFHADTPTLIGKVLKVYIIPNHEASKILQLGVFKVQSDKVSYAEQKHVVTAYDAMYDILNSDVTEWYNTILRDEDSSCTLGNFRESFINLFGLIAENITLPNDYIVLHRTIDPEMVSGADIIKGICELNGVFGVITNEGKFRYRRIYNNIRTLGSQYVVDIPIERYIDIHNEDYDSKDITGVKIITDKDSKVGQVPVGDNDNQYVVNGNFLISDFKGFDLQTIANRILAAVYQHYYQPCTLNALGNPVLEVGDALKIQTKNGFVYTYILERSMRGIQALRDTYTANGEEYCNENLNSLSSRLKQIGYNSAGGSSGSIIAADLQLVELIRNIGFRLLDEPSLVDVQFDIDNERVTISWTDPDDITTHRPVPCTWEGTVVVRKEGSPPLNRWDGEEVVDSTVRDQYSSTPFGDIYYEDDKVYYYGIFPYYTAISDPDYPIKYYRYTKSVKVETSVEFYLLTEDGDNITTEYGKKILV